MVEITLEEDFLVFWQSTYYKAHIKIMTKHFIKTLR